MLRRALAVVLALLLAGCGGGAGGEEAGGTAQLWVTRDNGTQVLLTAEVPSGLTVLQALDREADVKTRYGGRFVQAVDGIEGSLAGRRDWFYFVNGIEPDVGAAEVRLRPGDVAWWDFRSWADEMEAPVVVGAFPEPFVNGFPGRSRPVEVRAPAELADVAEALRAVIGRPQGDGEPHLFVLEIREGDVEGATLLAKRGAANDSPVTFVLSGSLEAVRGAAFLLANHPEAVRFNYAAKFDEAGNVLG
jgi:hypothetical protein